MTTEILNYLNLYQIQCIYAYLHRGFLLFMLITCTDNTESLYNEFHMKLKKIYNLDVFVGKYTTKVYITC